MSTQPRLPLPFVLALLNSKLADWYFRIGSTNAMVGEYQFNALPCPLFMDGPPTEQRRNRLASDKLMRGEVTDAFGHLLPFLSSAPFDPSVRELIVDATTQIESIERRRGNISRSDRSSLSPEAQPYQDFIDRVFFAMAGLSPEESAGLEERLATML